MCTLNSIKFVRHVHAQMISLYVRAQLFAIVVVAENMNLSDLLHFPENERERETVHRKKSLLQESLNEPHILTPDRKAQVVPLEFTYTRQYDKVRFVCS